MSNCFVCNTPFTKRRPNSCQKCYFKKRHQERYQKIPRKPPPIKNYHRIYFGRKFYMEQKGYWVCTEKLQPQAHRWVWINHFGEIPEGMHIHHIDEDKSNNEIENLKLMTPSEHLKSHWINPDDRAKRRKFLTEIRSKVHQWLRSDEGRKKQSEGAIKGWEKRRKNNIDKPRLQ